jgi:hypothetical protein
VSLGGGVLEVPQSPAFPLANSDSAQYQGSFWIRERNAKRLPFFAGTAAEAIVMEPTASPMFWQWIQVGHVKKFDNRLRIELLRAHMPNRFKTPGSHAPVIRGDNTQALLIDAEERAKLVRLRRKALEAMNPPKQISASNEAVMLRNGCPRLQMEPG